MYVCDHGVSDDDDGYCLRCVDSGRTEMEIPFMLVDGLLVDVYNLQDYEITADHIATGLSHLCRYGGQIKTPYSVAIHSVLVSHLVAPHLAYEGLMHDAPEALGMVDLPSPVKKALPGYKDLERRVRGGIAPRFHLLPEEPPEVKFADRLAYELERHYLHGVSYCPPLPRVYGHAVRWLRASAKGAIPAWQAYSAFMERYAQLAPDTAPR